MNINDTSNNDFDQMLITALISLIIFIVMSHVMLLTETSDSKDDDDRDENVDDRSIIDETSALDYVTATVVIKDA